MQFAEMQSGINYVYCSKSAVICEWWDHDQGVGAT